jgi:hypothetical protein
MEKMLLFFCCAGNNGHVFLMKYQRIPSVISVGAVNKNNRLQVSQTTMIV